MWRRWFRKPLSPPEVILYTRPGCHLCEDAHTLLAEAGQTFGFQVQTVNIEENPDLEQQHGLQIPVVQIDGIIRFRGRVNRVLLTRLLRGRQ
jgi:glutaredoxin